MSSSGKNEYLQNVDSKSEEFNLFGNSFDARKKSGGTAAGKNFPSSSYNQGVSSFSSSSNMDSKGGISSRFSWFGRTSWKPSTKNSNRLNPWDNAAGAGAGAGDADGNQFHSSKLHTLSPPSTHLVIDESKSKNTNFFNTIEEKAVHVEPLLETKPKKLPSRSRLGQLFSLFQKTDKSEDKKNKRRFPATTVTPRSLSNPSYKSVDTRRIGGIRRLVLKTKPVKYHLIDVNKVLSARQHKVVMGAISAEKLLKNDNLSDEEIEEVEEKEEEPVRKRFSKQTFDITNRKEERVETREEEKVPNLREEKQNRNFRQKVQQSPPPPQQQQQQQQQQYNGYWTFPSIDEISAMDEDCLRNLENFIIGRVGYGQIAYDYPVDLTKVKHDADLRGVSFAKQLFANVIQIERQTILAYKNEVHKPSLGMELNVPATITLEGVVNKKANLNEQINFLKSQIGMEYISYNPTTETWVFRVKHFSVWGLIDEDAQNFKELTSLKRKQDAKEMKAALEYSRVYEGQDLDQESKKQKLNEHTKIVPGGWNFPNPQKDSILLLKQSLVSDEIERELSRYNDTVDIMDEVDGNLIDSEEEGEEEGEKGESIGEMKVNVYEPFIEDESVFEKIRNNMNVSTASNWLLQLELANQFNSALAPLFETEKTPEKLTLSKVDDLIFSEFNKSKECATSKDSTFLGPISEVPDKEEIDENNPFVFSKVLSKCSFTSRKSNSIPKLHQNSKLLFRDFCDSNESDAEIELATILFEYNEKRSFEEIDYKFEKWLRSYNEESVNELLDKNRLDYLECAFICLCANDVLRAIEYALKSGSEHLAVILSLAREGDSLIKKSAQEQLKKWELGGHKIVPASIMKIYQLIAGPSSDLWKTLPWNIALCSAMAFDGTDTGTGTKSLKYLIERFEPVLPEKNSVSDVFKIFITGFDLVKLTTSHLSKKLQWIFCLVLADFEYDEVSKKFGQQLEAAGYWIEALIAYSSIKDDDLAKDLIRGLVIKKVGEVGVLDAVDEKYLVEMLKVPQSMIYEAMAIERSQRGDYWGEVEALLKNCNWEEVHKTIVTELGPNTVISCSSTEIERLKEVILQFPQNGMPVSEWNKGAGIYENYFQLCKENQGDIEVLEFLIDHLPLASVQSTKEKPAMNLISKFVGDLALENIKISNVRKKKILEFPMDETTKNYFKARISK
ncbi:NUP145 [Candida oxycetoniae]|uniref:NUP145 n=1 Tax=Candida oxycetoniae TaxID=497107 RepID=A0AAI9SUY1_9ASCO|nr:NUP145 [Candida oxycetoniae]KAI3403513.2 NUP145 [Candida oxycetoniae]